MVHYQILCPHLAASWNMNIILPIASIDRKKYQIFMEGRFGTRALPNCAGNAKCPSELGRSLKGRCACWEITTAKLPDMERTRWEKFFMDGELVKKILAPYVY